MSKDESIYDDIRDSVIREHEESLNAGRKEAIRLYSEERDEDL